MSLWIIISSQAFHAVGNVWKCGQKTSIFVWSWKVLDFWVFCLKKFQVALKTENPTRTIFGIWWLVIKVQKYIIYKCSIMGSHLFWKVALKKSTKVTNFKNLGTSHEASPYVKFHCSLVHISFGHVQSRTDVTGDVYFKSACSNSKAFFFMLHWKLSANNLMC